MAQTYASQPQGVQYYNGQLYAGNFLPQYGFLGTPINTPDSTNKNTTNNLPAYSYNGSMYQNPFGTAMSGTQSGTLQPYVNRMTQNASNALYGGLLGYSPKSVVAGDAGGTPQNSSVPQFNLPSAIPTTGQGLNFTGFGNRSWMGK